MSVVSLKTRKKYVPGAEEESRSAEERAAVDAPEVGIFDQTMPAAGIEDVLNSSGVVIFVLTTDTELVESALQVGDAQATILFVEESAALNEEMDQGRCDIVLLDIDGVGPMLDTVLTGLEGRSPPPVVVAAGGSNEAPELMRAMAERRIHRLLIKPASPGKIRLLLDAAITRSLQLREAAAGTSGPSARSGARPGGAGMISRRKGPLLAAAMALVFLAFVVAGLLRPKPSVTEDVDSPPQAAQRVIRERAEPPPAEAQVPAPGLAPAAVEEPVVVTDPVAERLARARSAFEAGRLGEPPGASALDGYAAILAAQPDHALAAAGLNETIDVLFTQVEAALLEEQLASAAVMLDHVRRVQPESPRLAFLAAQLDRARQAEAARLQAEAAAVVAPVAELDRLLGLSESRLQRGQLTQPEGDSALRYYRRAAALDAADPRVVALKFKLGTALVATARQSLEAGETGPAQVQIAEARSFGVDAAVLADLDDRLIALRDARQQERESELLALGIERLRDGRLIAPATDSAAYYLASVRAENPMHPELQAPWNELNVTLAANVRESLAASNWPTAVDWLAGLEQMDADAELLAALNVEMSVARRQAEFLEAAVPADELKLIEFRAPVYPEAARRKELEGWVDVEYIVGRDGRTREVTVLAAEPSGTFDRAAAHAVSRFRYEPFEEDGVSYDRRVWQRLRFTLE